MTERRVHRRHVKHTSRHVTLAVVAHDGDTSVARLFLMRPSVCFWFVRFVTFLLGFSSAHISPMKALTPLGRLSAPGAPQEQALCSDWSQGAERCPSLLGPTPELSAASAPVFGVSHAVRGAFYPACPTALPRGCCSGGSPPESPHRSLLSDSASRRTKPEMPSCQAACYGTVASAPEHQARAMGSQTHRNERRATRVQEGSP